MADEDQDEGMENMEEGDESSEDGKKKGKKKLLLILVPLLLLIGGGAGAYFAGLLDGLLGVENAEEASDDGHGDGHGGDDGHGDGHGADDGHGGDNSAFLEIPTMIVNLRGDEDGTTRYLRLSLQLELVNPSEKHLVEAVMPRVIDQYQTYLRELRLQDLKGSAGIYRLQLELLWRVNQAAHPVKIKDVLFQEILIQ